LSNIGAYIHFWELLCNDCITLLVSKSAGAFIYFVGRGL